MNTLPELAYDILRVLRDGSWEQIEILKHFAGQTNEANDLLFDLEKRNYISCSTDLRKCEALISITRYGRVALSAYDERTKTLEYKLKIQGEALDLARAQVAALEDVAATLRKDLELAQTQAKQAETTSKTARKDALFSKVISVLALLVSIAAIVVPAVLF